MPSESTQPAPLSLESFPVLEGFVLDPHPGYEYEYSFSEVARLPFHPAAPRSVQTTAGVPDSTTTSALVYAQPIGPKSRWFYESFALNKKSWDDFIVQNTDGLPRWHKIAVMKKVLEQHVGDWEERYIKRKISLWRAAGRIAACHKSFVKKEKAARQAAWLEGGREAHYRAKYPFGCVDHPWFTKRFAKVTGEATVCPWVDALPENNFREEADMAPEPRVSVKTRPKASQVEANLAPEGWAYPAPPQKKLNIELIGRIREIRSLLRSLPTPLAWAEYRRSEAVCEVVKPQSGEWEYADPQMDGLTGDTPISIKSENVVLTEANPASSTITSIPSFRYDWHQLCSTEKTIDYSSLTDRFTFYKAIQWDDKMVKGAEIAPFRMDLPVDFVDSVAANPGTMPMFIPFKIHRYFKSDIEIKFHLNSNKFQVGQLQISWQYLEKSDGNPLTNIYSRCQLPHVLLNAGTSNEATMRIPFKFIQPYLTTVQKKKALDRLYLGTLRCFVVSPLAIGKDGPPNCTVSVFIRFPNAQFTGMRDGSIAEPQMEAAAAAMVAGAVYDKFIGDKNCDNKSDNINPSYLVPTAAHSFCAGTGLVEKVQALRLDNSTVAVGRIGIDDSETSIGIPCRTFGMLKHFKWQMSSVEGNTTGSVLWSCDVNAQIDKSLVQSFPGTGDRMTTYNMPPVSVISSLYRQWRGSLEFRFDIIASQFHTGRLLCAYIPGAYGDMKVTLEQARNSPHVEFSLQDSTSFTFIVPYISDKVFWPRKYTGPHKYSEESSPSKLVLFVLNPLIPMQSVVTSVDIIPYVRAGVDFEVSIPVQPSIGLSDETRNTYMVKDKIYPTDGSSPYRATNYEGFGNDNKYIFYEGTAALGTASTFHAPEKKLSASEYYFGVAEKESDQPIVKWKLKDVAKTESGFVKYIVLWNVPNKGNFGIPFPALDEGLKYADKLAQGLKKGEKVATLLSYCYDYVDDSADTASNANLYFLPLYKKFIEDDWIIASAQMMDSRVAAEVPLAPTDTLPSTSGGQFNYNESFTDLKDLARRYQLYAEQDIKLPSGFSGNKPLAIFPVIPHGLALDVSSASSTFNIVRDGHIPIISSGYLYFRGSIRFKIILSADAAQLGGIKCWVQHHPDGDAGIRSLQVYPQLTAEDSIRSHTYAMHMQAMSVNSIIEFEVPFYQPGMYGLTRKPVICNSDDEICHHYTLGNIILGISGGIINKAFDFNLQIFYSVGDDFSFNVWRGFPAVVFTDEVWPVQEEQQPEKEIVWITGEPQMMEAQEVGEPEMMEWVKGWTRSSVKEVIPEVVESVREAVSDEVIHLRAEIKEVYDKSTKFDISIPVVTSAVGNLAHIYNNPTPKTVAISIANIIISFFSNSLVNLAKMIDAICVVLKNYWHRFAGGDKQVTVEAQPEGEEDEAAVQQFCAFIFTSVCCVAGGTYASPGKFPDVLRNINSGVSLYNNAIRLVQNSTDLIQYCIRYIVSTLDPSAALSAKLLNEVPDIRQWYEEATFLLDVRNRNKYVYDRLMMDRVFDACMLGSLIVSAGMTKVTPAGKLIIDTQKELRKLQGDLIQRGAHPDVRFEVFPLWIVGSPGIGKSYMVKDMARRLLESISYQHHGSLIYDIPSGAKYWSGCTNPAVLVSDDILQVKGTRREEELSMVFTIVSSSVLNPPMAAVEDKEKRLNPLLYIMLSNDAFPNLSNDLSSPEALYRRRRFLIKPQLKIEWAKQMGEGTIRDASQIPRDVTRTFGHLEFYHKDNVKDVDSAWIGPYEYDAMIEIIKIDFKKHCEDERANFITRMHDMYCLDPDYDDENLIHAIPELQQKQSLKEQMEYLKERIRDKVEAMRDPRYHDEESGALIRKFVNNVNKLKEKTVNASDKVRSSFSNMFSNASPQADDAVLVENVAAWTPALSKAYDALEDKAQAGVLEVENLCTTTRFFQSVINEAKTFSLLTSNTIIKPYLPEFFITAKTLRNLPCFSYANCDAEFNRKLDNIIERKLDIEQVRGSWYNENMLELFSVGSFSWLEKLRFLCLLPEGASSVVEAVFRYDMALEPAFKSDVDIANVDTRRTGDPILDNELSKDHYRKFILNMSNWNGLELFRKIFYCAVISMMKEMYKFNNSCWGATGRQEVETLLIRDSKDAFAGDVVHFRKLKKIFELLYTLADKNCSKLNKTKLLIHKHIEYLYSFTVLLGLLVSPDYNCFECQREANLFNRNIKSSKFCSVQLSLEAVGASYRGCSKLDCVFHNKIYYYMLCYGAVSCKKQMIPRADAYNNTFFVSNDIVDVRRALRADCRKRISSSFEALCRWLKHIFYHRIPETLSGLWNAIIFHIPKIIACVGIGLAFSGISYGVKSVMGTNSPSPQGYSFKFETPKHPVKSKVPISSKTFVTPQAGAIQIAQLSNKITFNTVFVVVQYECEGRLLEKSCRCLMLRGRAMLILRHYWEEYQYLVDRGYKLDVALHFGAGRKSAEPRHVIRRVGWAELQKVAWCSSSSGELTSNFGICELPMYIPMFCDITNYIASMSEHENVSSLCDLYVVNGESKFGMPLSVKRRFAVAETASSSQVKVDRAYQYNHQYKGLCGSVLVSRKGNSGNGSIIGIHVAGSQSSGNGFSEPIVREYLDGFFKGNPQPDVMPIPTQEDIDPQVELDSNLMMYGCVPPQFSHKESGKSKIVPSLLHGEIYPVRTEVNPLRPNDPRQPPGSDPLRDGCNKHGSGDIYPFDAAQMREVTDYMVDRVQQIMPPVRAEVKPLTLQQAVCGDVDVEYFDSLNWKSSEGFPLSSLRPKSARDKRWLFELKDGEFGYKLEKVDPQLKVLMKLRDKCFEKGIKPATIYVDCLKDYRLTPEKCRLPGKTRIFSIAPIQCSIDIRMYINDFCASVKKNRIYNSIGIGINPDSMEWTQLANYLFEVGDKIITLDYSNYGPCLMSQTVAAASECVVEWFRYHGAEPEHVKRVKWLIECDIINPLHLCANVVYQTLDGISSGSPLTGEMNSIPNLFYIRNCYLEIMSKFSPSLATMQTFDEKVRIVVYGDDLIMSVSDDICEIFNAISIRDCLALHGIKVTPAQKSAEMVPYTSIYEATFLKRSFTEHPSRKGVWLAPIERASVEECLNWIHVSDNPQEATLECCRASLDLAYSQGPEYYQNHYHKIKNAINKLGLKIEYKPWHQRDSEIFGDSQVSLDVTKPPKINLPWTYAPYEL